MQYSRNFDEKLLGNWRYLLGLLKFLVNIQDDKCVSS
jgi:hypothetical protein